MTQPNQSHVPLDRHGGWLCWLMGLTASFFLLMGCVETDRSRMERQIPLTKHMKVLGLPQNHDVRSIRGVGVKDSIYITGPVTHDRDEADVEVDPIEIQMRQAYMNVAKLLQEFGGTMNNVVREVIFVTDMDAGIAAATKVRPDAYSGHPIVAMTIVQVPQLASPDAMVQLEVTAKIHYSLPFFPSYQRQEQS